MTSRQTPWPRRWMMTDERSGALLWPALDLLPEGCGVIFRHYRTPLEQRQAMAMRVAEVARARRLFLAVAGDPRLAQAVGAAAVHNPSGASDTLPFSRSVHSIREALEARDEGAGLIFVSPIYPTASHPGATVMGIEAALRIAKASGLRAIALGGMTHGTGEEAIRAGFHGWAAIDAWTRRV